MAIDKAGNIAGQQFLKELLGCEDLVSEIRKNISELARVIPEIEASFGFDHKHPHHQFDVWEHTLCALSFAPNDFDVRLVLLLHDIGKPYCFTEEGGVRHFHGHGKVSADMSEKILKRLCFEREYISFICKLIEGHDDPISMEDIKSDRIFAEKKFQVQICDTKAHNPEKNAKRLSYIEATKNMFEIIKED